MYIHTYMYIHMYTGNYTTVRSDLLTLVCVTLYEGGFEWYVDPIPDLELWVRWTQAGCFSGLMHEQGAFESPAMVTICRHLVHNHVHMYCSIGSYLIMIVY